MKAVPHPDVSGILRQKANSSHMGGNSRVFSRDMVGVS
jgi:hypothetical protein